MTKQNRPCPKCRELGRDTSGNHLYLMRDDKTWTCSRDYHPKYWEVDGESMVNQESPKLTWETLQQLPSIAIKDRALTKEVVEFYQIKVQFSEETGEIVSHYYPSFTNGKLVAFKKRNIPKSFSWVKHTEASGKELFGQRLFPSGGKRVLISGGELDAVSAYQMLQEAYPNLHVACVSPMHGENMSDIKNNIDYISSFDTIYVATDMDEAGQKMAKDIVNFFGPEKTLLVKLPEKDVSDCLVKNKERGFISAFFSADRYKPCGIITITDIPDTALEPTKWGLSYPFDSLTKFTYGLTTKSVIGIGAGPGSGKTTFVQQLQKHLVYTHNEKVGIFSIEDTPDWTMKKLVGSIMNKPIHLPDCKYNLEEARAIKKSLEGKLYLFNHLESHNHADIVTAIRYFHSEGVRFFFIDPLSALHAHMDASETNTFLSRILVEFETMAKTLDVTFFHVNHLNNPQTGKDHGAGGKVYGGQFSGSRAAWKFSTDLWGLERNQLAEGEEERNEVNLVIIKNRLSGNTGSFKLRYDRTSGNLIEKHDFE